MNALVMKTASADCDNADAEELDRTVAPNMKHQTTTDSVSGASHRVSCTKKPGMTITTTVSHDAVVSVPTAS